MSDSAVVESIDIYPVKSCRGISLTESVVTARGLAHDRRWMCVREADGGFLTQREIPLLATVGVRVEPSGITLSSDDGDRLFVPVPAVPPLRGVTVWSDGVPAEDAGDEASEWLTRRLSMSERVRLVRFPDSHERPCDPRYTAGAPAHTAFADGFPILLVSAESLEELNGKLAGRGKAPVPMARFRPNVVVRGLGAGGEDSVRDVRIGDGILLRFVKPCSRCVVITRDQRSGLSPDPKEPTATLAAYRRGPDGKKILFGQNAIVLEGVGGTLAVGDRLSVVARSSEAGS